MVKISLECTLNWCEGVLGRTQRFQHACVIACRLGILLPFHDRLYDYALS